MLIGHGNPSKFMEWKILGITALKHATCALNGF